MQCMTLDFAFQYKSRLARDRVFSLLALVVAFCLSFGPRDLALFFWRVVAELAPRGGGFPTIHACNKGDKAYVTFPP